MIKLLSAALVAAAVAPGQGRPTRWCQAVKMPSVLKGAYANGEEVSATGLFLGRDFMSVPYTLESVRDFSVDMMVAAAEDLPGTLVGEVLPVDDAGPYNEPGIIRHFIFNNGEGLGEFFDYFAEDGTGGFPVNTVFRYGEEGVPKLAPWLDALAGKNPFVTFGKYEFGFTRATCRAPTEIAFTTVYNATADQREAVHCTAQASAASAYQYDLGMDRYEVSVVDEDTFIIHITFRDVAAFMAHVQRPGKPSVTQAGARAVYMFIRGELPDPLKALINNNFPEVRAFGEEGVLYGNDRGTSLLEGTGAGCYAAPCDDDDDGDEDDDKDDDEDYRWVYGASGALFLALGGVMSLARLRNSHDRESYPETNIAPEDFASSSSVPELEEHAFESSLL